MTYKICLDGCLEYEGLRKHNFQIIDGILVIFLEDSTGRNDYYNLSELESIKIEKEVSR